MNRGSRRIVFIANALSTLAMLYGASVSAQTTVAADREAPGEAVLEAGPEDGKLCCLGLEPLIFHDDEALAVTGRAGIFKSTGNGANWARSMEGLIAPNGVSPFVDGVCQAPSDPRIVYALVGSGGALAPFNGFFASADFGKTWTRRGPADTFFGINICTVDINDPRTVYLMGNDSSTFLPAIWKSTDGGETQQVFGGNLPSCGLGAVFPRRGALYLLGSCGFMSTDDGASFQPLSFPPNVSSGGVSPDGRTLFLNTAAGPLRSVDGGASFMPVDGLPNGFNPLDLAFNPADSSRIYATDGLLHVSTDGGATFKLVPTWRDPRIGAPIDDISVNSRGSLFVDTVGGIFQSDDGGKTFRSVHHGFRASSVNDLAFDADGKLLVAVYHTKTLFRQTQGLDFKPIGNTPEIVVDGFNNDGTAVAGSPVDSNVILVGTLFEGVFRTDNGGESWTPATFSDGASLFARSRMIFANESRVYLTAPSGFYRSDDAGRSFELLADLPFGSVAVDPGNAEVLYVGTYSSGDGLFKSTDGGRTLQNLQQPGAFSALAVDQRYPQIVYAGRRSGQVIRSLDGGETFAPASVGLAGAGVHGLAEDANGTLFVWIRAGGLYASDDRAAGWHAVDTREALQRSGVESGRGSLVVDPRRPGHVFLGNGGVIEIAADHR